MYLTQGLHLVYDCIKMDLHCLHSIASLAALQLCVCSMEAMFKCPPFFHGISLNSPTLLTSGPPSRFTPKHTCKDWRWYDGVEDDQIYTWCSHLLILSILDILVSTRGMHNLPWTSNIVEFEILLRYHALRGIVDSSWPSISPGDELLATPQCGLNHTTAGTNL